jgi:CheY-like chemotaxis protein
MLDTRVLIVAPPSLAQLFQHTVSTAENGSGIHVTGIAATAAEAIALMAAEPPDILLIDLSENSAEGLQTVQTLRECNPRVIILAHVHAIFVSVQDRDHGRPSYTPARRPIPAAARGAAVRPKFAAQRKTFGHGLHRLHGYS